jgi:hypothetical protein
MYKLVLIASTILIPVVILPGTALGSMCSKRLDSCLSKSGDTSACREVCAGTYEECLRHGGWSTKGAPRPSTKVIQ